MQIKYASLNVIDHDQQEIIPKKLPEAGNEINDYIDKLLSQITQGTNKKSFAFKSKTTEVRSQIEHFLAENYLIPSKTIAARLLDVEITAQKGIEKLGKEIQKGSLFQTVIIDDDGLQKIIISKADHDKFLDVDFDFEVHQGLPLKKKVFKAVLVTFDDTLEVTEVFVFDTNDHISDYWWNKFLELTESHTAKYNTERSLDTIEKRALTPYKNSFPADHTILRNSMIGYFRNRETFELDNFIETLFHGYHPVNPELPLKKIIETIRDLPEKKDFDTHFNISKPDIKKRLVTKFELTPNIELIVKDFRDTEHDIEAGIDDEGKKFIKILTDEGYNRFKTNKNAGESN